LILVTLFFYSRGTPIPDKVIVGSVQPDSPAEQAGLQPDDLFLAVNDQAIDSSEKLNELIAENQGLPTQVTVLRGDQTLTLTLTPRVDPPEGVGRMGVMLDYQSTPVTVLEAAQRGVLATYEYTHTILTLPMRVLQGQVSPQQARPVGYKGMYDIFVQVRDPLWFFSIISLSLGIMNLLPIPALDGGRILFTLPEIVIRRRIPPEYETFVHMVGFVLLLLLLVYINLQDFINPIQLP